MVATRAEVALRAKVSPAVVSYVTNPGGRSVSAAARARVEEAIAALGYRPNAIAQSLRRSSTKSIAFIVPTLRNPSIAAIEAAIETIAFSLGYTLFVATTTNDPDREERYLRRFVERKVDAIVIVGTLRPDLLTEIATRGLPVLALGTVDPGLGVSTVSLECRESTAAVIRHLVEVHGHRRIACIGGPTNQGYVRQRMDAWRDTLVAAELPCDETLIVRPHQVTRATGYDAAMTLLENAAPTAIFCVDETLAAGASSAIAERGLRIPQDVALATWGSSELVHSERFDLTSFDMRIETVAATVMGRLAERMTRKSSPETHDLVPPVLTFRGSCGCGVAVNPESR